jgi:hypothetical protein
MQGNRTSERCELRRAEESRWGKQLAQTEVNFLVEEDKEQREKGASLFWEYLVITSKKSHD